jgi:signal transduction histidine kinase
MIAMSDSAAAPVSRGLRRFGRRYPAVGRAAVGVLCAAASPFSLPPRGPVFAVAVASAVVVWNLVYLAALLPDGRSCRLYRAVCAVDVFLVCGLCLAKPVLVDPGQQVASLGWVSPIASFTVVAVQFQLGVPAAAAATVAVCAAFLAGAAMSPGLTVWDGVFAGGGGWMVVEAVLARLLWVLLQRAGREADRLMRARFDAERTAATAAARRSAQRAHWATLHDTSASTLLMVGLGTVRGTEAWLPGQVRRDIRLLGGVRAGPPDAEGAEVALEPALHEVARAARVRVELNCPADLTAPAAVVRAVAGAAAEALENVARHAGVDDVRVDVRRDGESAGVEVVVADDGVGFDPTAVGAHRFGLALSVHDRMDAAGGYALVESAPGRGTVVRLRWPG